MYLSACRGGGGLGGGVSMHQCSVPRPSPGREMRGGGGGFDGQSFEENKGGSVSVSKYTDHALP
jgi:hypothetical protein